MVTTNLITDNQSVVRGEERDEQDKAERERDFSAEFPNDRACLDYLLQLRFGTRIKCPKCGRTAKFHKIRQIPAYACQWCGYHLHPMANTRFARSRVGLLSWFRAIELFTHVPNGISARQLERRLDLSYKTAWRIRNAIVDAKSALPRHRRREGGVTFEELLAVMLSPAPDKGRPE